MQPRELGQHRLGVRGVAARYLVARLGTGQVLDDEVDVGLVAVDVVQDRDAAGRPFGDRAVGADLAVVGAAVQTVLVDLRCARPELRDPRVGCVGAALVVLDRHVHGVADVAGTDRARGDRADPTARQDRFEPLGGDLVDAVEQSG